MSGDMLDRIAQAINPRAFGPIEGHYLFKAWQKEDQDKAYKSAEAVLRTLRDGPTYAVMFQASKALQQTDYIDPFDQFKEAWSSALNEALRLGGEG